MASGAAVVLVGVIALTWVRLAHPAEAQPASWKIANDALVILDSNGRVLWTKTFDFRLTESAYQNRLAQDEGLQPVVIDDINGDGNAEVLFVSEPWLPTSHGLYCFDHRGNVLFHREPDYVVRFGEKTYAPPWRGAFVSTTGLPRRPHGIWFVSTQLEDFPTVLEKLDASGNVKGKYWSNGQISRVVTGQVAGRSVVFVGACSNEFGGGSLAVLDAEHLSGVSPATKDYYRCGGCPGAAPVAFLVFPSLDVTVAMKQYSRIANVFPDALGQIMVDVLHSVGERLAPELQRIATSHYTLDPQFRVINGEMGTRVPVIHRVLEGEGLLDHPFSPEYDSRFLWPVLRWDGSTFVQITGPEPRERR